MQYTFDASRKCYVWLYDSMVEMIDTVMAKRTQWEGHDNAHPAWTDDIVSAGSRASFIGREFSGWSDVADKANVLWPEGMQRFEEMMGELSLVELPKPVSRRRTMRWREDDGDEFDRERMMTGKPFWLASVRENRVGAGSVTIVTDVTTGADVRHYDVLWRGAAAICLTSKLEEAGYRVELHAAEHAGSTYKGDRGYFISVCLKRTSDPIDVSTLINAVSGWCYRTLFLGACSVCEDSPPCCTLGVILPFHSLLGHVSSDENMIVASGIWNMKSAVKWVSRNLEKIGNCVN